MALSKVVTSDSGVVLSYHRIGLFNVVYSDTCMITMQVDSYVSEDVRKDKKKAVETKKYTINNTVFNTYFSEAILKESGNSSRVQAYTYLKTLDDWTDAVDC